MLELRKNQIAYLMGKRYNEEIDKLGDEYNWAKLSFIRVQLIRDGKKFYLLEGWIDGEYAKYTNNMFYKNQQVETRHFTAFSHFTYQISEQNYMVCDL